MKTLTRGRAGARTRAADLNANFLEAGYTILLSGQTAAGSFVVPAGHKIVAIDFAGNNANAVNGGLKFGTTAGGTDVVTAQAVAGNSLGSVPAANISKRVFSKTASQTVYFDAVTGWASANVDIAVSLSKVF